MADILRLIAGGLLGLLCCYGGVLIKRYYADREKVYRDAEQFTAELISEIGFKKTPLPVVIAQFAEGKSGKFCKTLSAFGNKLGAGVPQDKAAAEEAESVHLRKDEKKRLKEFLEGLGKTSLGDQMNVLKRAREEFAAKRDKCAEETKRLGGMYFKLAVLVGIALIVILA